jgi:hypothetical protein
MVGASNGCPPNVGEGSSRPSNERQLERLYHLIKARKKILWEAYNPKKARASIKSTRGGRESLRQLSPTMTTPTRYSMQLSPRIEKHHFW